MILDLSLHHSICQPSFFFFLTPCLPSSLYKPPSLLTRATVGASCLVFLNGFWLSSNPLLFYTRVIFPNVKIIMETNLSPLSLSTTYLKVFNTQLLSVKEKRKTQQSHFLYSFLPLSFLFSFISHHFLPLRPYLQIQSH